MVWTYCELVSAMILIRFTYGLDMFWACILDMFWTCVGNDCLVLDVSLAWVGTILDKCWLCVGHVLITYILTTFIFDKFLLKITKFGSHENMRKYI